MGEASLKNPASIAPLWWRILVCVVFFVSANALAGFIAVRFDYPSLFAVDTNFVEYAVPLPFTWALSHLPSTLFALALLSGIHAWQEKTKRYFRAFCLVIFSLLFLEGGEKNPFILFAKIDLFLAFLFSLILAPPSSAANPYLVRFLKISAGILMLGICLVLFSRWQHRTPSIVRSDYGKGFFELQTIIVQNDFHKTMIFEVLLTRELAERDVCIAGQELALSLLEDYPFDSAYNKIVYLSFDLPLQNQETRHTEIGEISLMEEDKEEDNLYPCYVTMDFGNQGRPIAPLLQ